jgi:hypothetical protein
MRERQERGEVLGECLFENLLGAAGNARVCSKARSVRVAVEDALPGAGSQ